MFNDAVGKIVSDCKLKDFKQYTFTCCATERIIDENYFLTTEEITQFRNTYSFYHLRPHTILN